MFINRLNIVFKNPKLEVNPKICPKNFVDLYFDTAGWYAVGHHNPEQFLAVVTKHDSYYSGFSVAQVKQTWATFNGNDFEITNKPVPGAVAITIIEDLMYLSGLL